MKRVPAVAAVAGIVVVTVAFVAGRWSKPAGERAGGAADDAVTRLSPTAFVGTWVNETAYGKDYLRISIKSSDGGAARYIAEVSSSIDSRKANWDGTLQPNGIVILQNLKTGAEWRAGLENGVLFVANDQDIWQYRRLH